MTGGGVGLAELMGQSCQTLSEPQLPLGLVMHRLSSFGSLALRKNDLSHSSPASLHHTGGCWALTSVHSSARSHTLLSVVDGGKNPGGGAVGGG